MGSTVAENIFESTNVMIQKALQDQPFNKTAIAIITEVKNEGKGEYLCTEGSAQYIAYSANIDTKYKKGDSVYVLVPNADYS